MLGASPQIKQPQPYNRLLELGAEDPSDGSSRAHAGEGFPLHGLQLQNSLEAGELSDSKDSFHLLESSPLGEPVSTGTSLILLLSLRLAQFLT